VTLGSPPLVRRLAADGGFDWLMIDTEHNPMSRETAAACIQAAADGSRGRTAPLVRVPDLAVSNIKQALDSGAYGVLAPMINTVAEVEAFVSNCHYPPQGMRGVYSAPSGLATFDATFADYYHGANEQVLVSVQIETLAALEVVEGIAAVDGLDVLFVGPGDLHAALGLMPRNDSDEPDFLAALDRIVAAGRKHRKTVGTLCMTVETAHRRIAQGFNFVAVGNDIGHLLAGARGALSAVRSG
jgi:2-keto-3-deoxy-L-rhamnonate aldolase RhmA